MDGWTAVYNWGAFCVLAGGLAYYYIPKSTKTTHTQPAPVKDLRKENKKVSRKPVERKSAVPLVEDDTTTAQDQRQDSPQNGNKKRKSNAPPIVHAPAIIQKDEDDIDMGTRQFAASMQKAREGVSVKSSNTKEARVRTVKPKNNPAHTPALSSGSSQADDAEEDWSQVQSPALRTSGVEDMLEPVASGPASLRITAPEKPVKEKVNKQPKKEVVETKKQRQNRRKAEDRKLERQADLAQQNVRKEQQMRTARESRGEPSRNGMPTPSAPAQNPWADSNASRDVQLPVVSNPGSNIQLLDTIETESNSSSAQDNSTTATSVDESHDSHVQQPQNIVSVSQEYEATDLAKALEASSDDLWTDVSSKKKSNKKKGSTQKGSDGNTTPVAAPITNGKVAPTTRNAYYALNDEDAA